jgi:hypothetical protein
MDVTKKRRVAVRHETHEREAAKKEEEKSSSLFELMPCLLYNSISAAAVPPTLKAFKYYLYKHKNAFSMIR